MHRVKAPLIAAFARQSTITVLGLAVLFAGIALMFRYTVGRRLTRIAQHFKHIAARPDSARITPVEVGPPDEISTLAASFNALAHKLGTVHTSLEQRVVERTDDGYPSCLEQTWRWYGSEIKDPFRR